MPGTEVQRVCYQNVALTDANDNVLRQLPLALHREIKLDLSKRMLSAVQLPTLLSYALLTYCPTH
eukprot:3601564-Rhodomonas_salina.3